MSQRRRTSERLFVHDFETFKYCTLVPWGIFHDGVAMQVFNSEANIMYSLECAHYRRESRNGFCVVAGPAFSLIVFVRQIADRVHVNSPLESSRKC